MNPENDYDKNIIGQAVEAEPRIIKKFRRPDQTTVEVRFYLNQFGGYYVSTKGSEEGDGQRLHGHLETDPDEYLAIWAKGLGYKEIKED